jgi:hypothetical protein
VPHNSSRSCHELGTIKAARSTSCSTTPVQATQSRPSNHIRKMPHPCNAPNSDTQCSTTKPQPLHHEVHSFQTGCYNSQNNLLTTARPHSLTATNVVSPMQAQQSVLICAASSRSASHSTVRLLRCGVERQWYTVPQLTPLLTSP